MWVQNYYTCCRTPFRKCGMFVTKGRFTRDMTTKLVELCLPFPYLSQIMGQDDRAKIQQSVGECYLKAASIIVGSRICETPIVKTPAAKRKTVRLRYSSWHTSLHSPFPPCASALPKHCLKHMLYTGTLNFCFFQLLGSFLLLDWDPCAA